MLTTNHPAALLCIHLLQSKLKCNSVCCFFRDGCQELKLSSAKPSPFLLPVLPTDTSHGIPSPQHMACTGATAQQTALGCTCVTSEETFVDIHSTLLSTLFTSLLSSCHVWPLTSNQSYCRHRHTSGLIRMINVASWLLYAPLSTCICCVFAYWSATVNQGIFFSLLSPHTQGPHSMPVDPKDYDSFRDHPAAQGEDDSHPDGMGKILWWVWRTIPSMWVVK